MSAPQIDAMPPAPEPTNSREVFSARTFAFYAAMAGFIGQVTAALSWVATQLSSISALATIAATARNDAVTAASTATTTANTIVSNATTTATSAAASASADAAAAAAAAALSAGATKWVAGTYADGALAWSPSSRQTYRRKGSGSSATDPVGDPENWEPIARDAVGAIIAIAANTTAQRFQTYYFGGAAITLTLPAVAYAGDWVGIIPPLNATPSTQQVANNGHLLLGEAAAMVIDVRQPLRLVYASAEAGWIIAT